MPYASLVTVIRGEVAVLDNSTTVPIAGWYADPSDPTRERWWGGVEWTHSVRPLEVAVQQPVFAQQSVYTAPSPAAFSGLTTPSPFSGHSAMAPEPEPEPAAVAPAVVADVPVGALRERRRRDPDPVNAAVVSDLPEEGWYPDPADAAKERRWSGSKWTHELRPLTPPSISALPPADVPGGGVNPFAAAGFKELWQAEPIAPPRVDTSWNVPTTYPVLGPPPTNGLATAGLVLSLLCISALGLVFSIIGLVRANNFAREGHPPVGRTRAAWGLAASFAVPVLIGILASIAIPVFLNQQQQHASEQVAAAAEQEGVSESDVVMESDGTPVVYDRAEIEQAYRDSFTAEGISVESVSCPDEASMVVGGGFTCSFVSQGATHLIGVIWTSNTGDFTTTLDGVIQK